MEQIRWLVRMVGTHSRIEHFQKYCNPISFHIAADTCACEPFPKSLTQKTDPGPKQGTAGRRRPRRFGSLRLPPSSSSQPVLVLVQAIILGKQMHGMITRSLRERSRIYEIQDGDLGWPGPQQIFSHDRLHKLCKRYYTNVEE